MEDADPASPEELCRANGGLRSPRGARPEKEPRLRGRGRRENARRGWPASIGRTCGGSMSCRTRPSRPFASASGSPARPRLAADRGRMDGAPADRPTRKVAAPHSGRSRRPSTEAQQAARRRGRHAGKMPRGGGHDGGERADADGALPRRGDQNAIEAKREGRKGPREEEPRCRHRLPRRPRVARCRDRSKTCPSQRTRRGS